MRKSNEVWIDRMPIGYAKLQFETDQKDVKQFRFSQVNESFELIVGMDRSMIEGKTFQEILLNTLETDCKLYEFCKAVCEAGKPDTFEQVVNCNGRDFQVAAIAENKHELVLLMDEITELVRLRKEMKAYQDELERLNDRLYRESITDEMTGLFNRKHIIELLEKEVARAERGLESLTIAMLDIDAFKSVNDIYGHQFGDFVLKEFSDALEAQVRHMDYVGRYGGEEFLLIFPGTKIGDAIEILDRIESMLQVYEFRQGEAAVTLQFSAGVVQYNGESIDYLIRRADELLYRAKERGKSQVAMN